MSESYILNKNDKIHRMKAKEIRWSDNNKVAANITEYYIIEKWVTHVLLIIFWLTQIDAIYRVNNLTIQELLTDRQTRTLID